MVGLQGEQDLQRYIAAKQCMVSSENGAATAYTEQLPKYILAHGSTD
jgi:hypothetical protein